MTKSNESNVYPRLISFDRSEIFPLQKRIVTIGSEKHCHIKIGNSSLPLHIGHIMYDNGQYVLHILNSTKEVKINNQVIAAQHIFRHADEIEIGAYKLIFESHDSGDSPIIETRQGEKITSESPAPLHEMIAVVVSLLKNRNREVFTDLVASISRLLKSDAARLVFEDILSGERQTIARFPQNSGLDRFSNRAIDWAKNASGTILASDDQWQDPSQSITINKVASILCAPLKEGDSILGFLYLDRVKSREPFNENDRSLCDALIPLFSEILSYHSERQRQQNTIDRLQRNHLLHSSGLIFTCQEMEKLYNLTVKYARTDSPALILGETGTGKELLARMLHEKSTRSGKPFKAINCGAIPETLIESELFGYEKGAFTGANSRTIGLLESANGGSVFLDEIAELPIQMQVKLLRAIQEKEITRLGCHETVKINIRIIAATNRNLEQEIAAGRFRQDLYFRLNVLTLNVPPLRDRGEDILLLADYFNTKYCQQFGLPLKTITSSAQNSLTTYDWPGNVRELENIIQKAILTSSTEKISSEHIEISTAHISSMTLKEARSTAERELITLTLKKTKGNISLSAKLLEIDRKWLMKIMDDLGIDADTYRN